jgi:hypothetical protein
MSRYKGRTSLRTNESKFPHHVDMMVPERRLWRSIKCNAQVHDARGIPAIIGQSRRENERDIIRWCFADSEIAKAFASEFGSG